MQNYLNTFNNNNIMTNKKETRSVYVDILKWKEWEEWCDNSGRVLSKVIPLAMEKYIKENN